MTTKGQKLNCDVFSDGCCSSSSTCVVPFAQVLNLLPSCTSVPDVMPYLESVLSDAFSHKRNAAILRSLLHSEHLQVITSNHLETPFSVFFVYIRKAIIPKKSIGHIGGGPIQTEISLSLF